MVASLEKPPKMMFLNHLGQKHSPNLTGTPFSYEYKLDKSITKKKKQNFNMET